MSPSAPVSLFSVRVVCFYRGIKIEQNTRLLIGLSSVRKVSSELSPDQRDQTNVSGLSYFRDLFFISSIKSQKYCDEIQPPQRRVTQLADKEVHSIDLAGSPLTSREYLELRDHEMDVWLRVSPSRAAVRVRMVVTPVLRSCSSSDVWWTSCSQLGARAGPCVRRDLLCDGIINCGASGGSSDEAGERCRSRVKAGDSGSWFLPSLITLVSSGIFITGLMLFCCTLINRDKIRSSFQGPRGRTVAPAQVRDVRRSYLAPTAPEPDTDLEDRPPSYAEAILLPRP